MSKDVAGVAKQLLDAIERGDVDEVGRLYAPDAAIWHNTDGKTTSREQNLSTLAQFVRAVPERRYTERRIHAWDSGFVEQHVLVGRLANGKELRLNACLICEVKNGQITRLDEYFDSAALAVFRD